MLISNPRKRRGALPGSTIKGAKQGGEKRPDKAAHRNSVEQMTQLEENSDAQLEAACSKMTPKHEGTTARLMPKSRQTGRQKGPNDLPTFHRSSKSSQNRRDG